MTHTKMLLVSIVLISLLVVSALPLQAFADSALFKASLIAPGNANITRRQWGQIIANSMQQVGIDARVIFLGWGAVFDRVFTPPVSNLGKMYDDGGWDIQLIGWTPGLFPLAGAYQIFYGKNFAPSGSNYYLFDNKENNALVEQFMTAGYSQAGETAFKRWQQLMYREIPVSTIMYQAAPLAANKAINFHGWEWYFDNIGPEPQFLSGKESIVLAATGELLSINPPLSNSWYDTIAYQPIYGQLILPRTPTNILFDHAASYTVSPDGREFTYKIKQGIKWHDGVELTADDLLFTVLGTLNPSTASQQSSFYAGYLGEDVTFKWENATTTRLVIDLNPSSSTFGQGWYRETPKISPPRKATVEAVDKYTVKYTLANFGTLDKPTGTFHTEAFPTYYIIPKHVLEKVPFGDWANHPFNTGRGTYTAAGQTFSGPIGTGPYKFVSFDSVKGLVTLERFDQYWNASGLKAMGRFTAKNYYVRYIVEKDPAIAALKTGEVDILDQNYQLQKDWKKGILDFAKVYELKGTGRQEMGYNMKHPILGTGVGTPLGKKDPTKAAEAAKRVRTAIDYLIPRKLIIDNLLDGIGEPGVTPAAPTQVFFDSSLKTREYSIEKARAELAAAGYGATSTPVTISEFKLGELTTPIELGRNLTTPVQVGPPGTTPTTPGQITVKIPAGVIAGVTPLTITGIYSNPITGAPYSKLTAELQVSKDNVTWTRVSVGPTDSSGRYLFIATPPSKGTYYYRVFFPGVTFDEALFRGAAGAGYDYSKLPQALPPSYSVDVVKVNAIDWSDVFSWVPQLALRSDMQSIQQSTRADFAAVRKDLQTVQDNARTDIATVRRDLQAVQDNTRADISTVRSDLVKVGDSLGGSIKQLDSKVSGDIGGVKTDVSKLQNSINNLQGQVSSLTTAMYGLVALIVIVGAAGFIFARKKK